MVGDKLRCDVIWALSFTVLEPANSCFYLLISKSCGERSVSIRTSSKGSELLVDIHSDKLVQIMVVPFSIRTLAIAIALTGQGGVFFTWPVRRLKVCHAFLL